MYVPSFSKAALVALGVFSFSETYSQSSSKYEAGLNLGAFVYQGDLVPERVGSLKTIKPGIGVSFGRIFTPSFSVRALFNLASLKGDDTKYGNTDAYRTFRAFKSTTFVKELAVQAKWDVLGSAEYESRFDPYLFAGAGLAFINAKRDYSGFRNDYFSETGETDLQARLTEDLTHKQRRTVPVFPAGAGLRYNMSSGWSVNTEMTYRFTNSDYMDGYSIAANPAKNDHYFSQTVGVSYRLRSQSAGGIKCPKF